MRIFIVSLVMALTLTLGFTTDGLCAKGLKKTVAVLSFQNDSGYSSMGDIGDDFSMQLNDALMQSGNFIVLSRQDLDAVFAEQDLAGSNRMAASNTAKTGKAIPAQILIKGRITEFDEQKSGTGQGLSLYGVSLGTNKASAHVAVILQLIDSTTGEILDSQRIEGDAKAGGFSIGYSGEFGINTSSFKKTPLGKAVQMAIDQAVVHVTKKSAGIPWRGRVMLVKDGLVYVNSGNNVGITSGENFSVYREGEALVDPDTGMELGKENAKIADITITEVQDKFSKATVAGATQMEIAKGDLILEQ